VIVYDCEIKKGIPSSKEPSEADIQYCDGWRDFKNMGCSLITVFDFKTCFPRVFMDDNIVGFFELIERCEIAVGFNNHNFDDNLIAEMGVKLRRFTYDTSNSNVNAVIPESFDLLRAIWKAAGLDPNSYGYHHQGYGLDDLCLANLRLGKRGSGAIAAILYQRQKYGSLIDYGLTDVMLTTWLLALCKKQPIVNPKKPGERLFVEIPFDVPPIAPVL
jgi:hypothetical protein